MRNMGNEIKLSDIVITDPIDIAWLEQEIAGALASGADLYKSEFGESRKGGKQKPPKSRGEKRPYINIDRAWLICASQKSSVIAVIGLLWFYHVINREKKIKVTLPRCKKFGLDRHKRRRGLQALEAKGLIAIQWSRTKSPSVTLLLPQEPAENEGGEA